MSIHAVYLANGHEPDAAIQRGLTQAGCEIARARSIGETLDRLPRAEGGNLAEERETPTIVAAELQAGALALLSIVRERMRGLAPHPVVPPTLVFDREGRDIYAPIKALRLGAREYLLASDPDIDREFGAHYLVERVMTEHGQRAQAPQQPSQKIAARAQAPLDDTTPTRQKIEWEPVGRVIRVGGKYIHLSPIEARMFNLLLENAGRTVTMQDLMRYALNKPDMSAQDAVHHLRPHMMRLRRKLAVQPDLASRLVNTRGTGYLLRA